MKSDSEDPLRKREQFAVSLRKKKKQKIISNKRSRLVPLGAFRGVAQEQNQEMEVLNAVKEVSSLLSPEQEALDIN